MTDNSLRSVTIERSGPGRFTATNARGGTLTFGTGSGTDFTPVELFLAAIGGCSAADVEVATSRHTDPTTFTVTVTGNKVEDESGNRLSDLDVAFSVTFPDGPSGDRARAILPRAVKTSHDRLCTVSRTVEAGTPVSTTVSGTADGA
ncbi:OsmC family protein [Streptomyces flavofungini]|uniref:OsmC family protein n=1 Tax=Streptomyces flavofungini TaxID=68200 RepID=A0ABS0XBL6_9ACTN|nr:OsmC family protein [Streptomyces flavofungini]MBJ3810582.1 OsmC family protein [Streptomyces flavofungini]GHC83790.1 osmotically inducible protein C [Streptomyces flavofungini]